jgi:hypothetical protein
VSAEVRREWTKLVGGDPFLVAGTGWAAGLVVTACWAGGVWLLAAVLLVRRDP